MTTTIVWCGLAALMLGVSGCGGSDSEGASGAAGATPSDGGSDAVEEASDSGPDSGESEAGGSYSLTVVGGYGSGSFAEGESVHVWAAVRPWTEIVSAWSGDTDVLEMPNEWHTTLVMPARDVTIEPVVGVRDEVFEEWSYKGTTQSDKTVIYYVPDAPRGLVFLLHGTGGSARMIEKPEERYVALSAIARGYAVVATEAEEVAAGDLNDDGKVRWNPALEPGNTDFANLDALVAGLRQQGVLDTGVPLYVLGMSNGGAMSVSLGAIAASPVANEYPNLRFGAAISFCASGRPGAAAISTTPTGWLLCANDDNEEVSNQEAAENSAALGARGIPTFVDAHPASPLYDERFMRVPGVDEATSEGIAAELRAGGFVGADGLFDVSTTDLAAQVQGEPGAFPTAVALPGATLNLVVDQIRVMQAEHQMYSDWASRAVDFLDAH